MKKEIKNKITAAEKELRIYQVYELILKGLPRYKIVLYGRDKWDACERSMDNYIGEVYNLMRDYNLKNHEHNLNLMNSRIEDLINKCYNENDKKTMVQLLKLQSDILGLNKIQMDISGNIEHSIDVIKLISIKKEDDNGIGD